MGCVALYARVSTNKDQSVETQLFALRDWAVARGHEVVAEYTDEGISGAKGRDKRPLDAMMKDAARGKFDMVAATALDRLGRSLQHLVGMVAELDALRVGLFVQNMALDTSTPVGRLMFNMVGAFAEFERGLIRERTLLGLERARRRGSRLGRPKVGPTTERQIVALLEAKTPVNRIVRQTGVGVSVVYRIKKAMAA
ncbi:resolvase [Pseudoxanthomonas broegbernensis]|uniref:Resolvase n=1 Tax=Pseudoxanthomonas broegbernensis TaxID=83619 RepID=A0A7V8GLI2_9GAMM|nr:recombinase family protein [Pseudoxanthomonas broegbernensis]KAF1685875.1 resolvase [Pseudoxanthomonas broegbernensis]MBB6064096.1 DNA invertase Pin-like site-specific DNA recombinase [Pseudoxanthomonas broegbernensis]